MNIPNLLISITFLIVIPLYFLSTIGPTNNKISPTFNIVDFIILDFLMICEEY